MASPERQAIMLMCTIVVVNNKMGHLASDLRSHKKVEHCGSNDVSKRTVQVRPRHSAPVSKARQKLQADAEVELDGLTGHVGYAVRRFQLWIFQDFIKTLSAVEITPTQYSVLTVIGENPGLTQMAVANRLGIERARLVHLLDGLEGRRLVERVPSKTDRRSHALHLTSSGQISLRRFKLLAAEHERHVVEKIGKENREHLLKILSVFR